MERAEDFPERHLPRWTCSGQDVGRVIVGEEGVLEVVAEKFRGGQRLEIFPRLSDGWQNSPSWHTIATPTRVFCLM